MTNDQAADVAIAKDKAGRARSHVKRATDNVERAIERELPILDRWERRRFWLLVLSYAADRLREPDQGAKPGGLVAEIGPEAPTGKEIAEAQAELHTGDTCQPEQQQTVPQSPEPASGAIQSHRAAGLPDPRLAWAWDLGHRKARE